MDRRSYYYNKRSRYGKPSKPSMRAPRRRVTKPWKLILIIVLIAAVVTVGIIFLPKLFSGSKPKPSPKPSVTATPTPTPTPTATPTETPTETPTSGFVPSPDPSSDPSANKFETKLQVNYEATDTFQRATAVNMPAAKDYTALQGITTFRGNNYRDTASYGQAAITEAKLEKVWDAPLGKLDSSNTGMGWTGQPLVVKWTDEQKKSMNLNATAKAVPDLKEIILGGMDGKVYFLNLTDGKATRTAVDTKAPILGTPTLDPRGYPLLYVGQGSDKAAGKTVDVSFRAVNLIDGTFSNMLEKANLDGFKYRRYNAAFISSALLDAASDTLLAPSSNGVLYTLGLKTSVDAATGKPSFTIDTRAKYKYTTPDYGVVDGVEKPWGFYGSPVVYKNYMFVTDNGGYLQCIDLNTLALVWVTDVGGIANNTVVLEEDETAGTVYLYTGSSVDPNNPDVKKSGKGDCNLSKIDGKTGKIIWSKPYTCYKGTTTATGGAIASPVLGKGQINNMVVFTLSRYKSMSGGVMVALDKASGNELWQKSIEGYTDSSPADVYTSDGKAYIVQCNNKGTVFLVDSAGEIKDKMNLNGAIEGSPVVYENMIVVGTKNTMKCYGIKIK